MTAIVESKNFDRPGALALDGFDLCHGSVLVLATLNDENRAGDSRQIFFDIPTAEIGVKPDAVPSPETASGIAMMAAELFRKIRSFEFRFGFGDAGHAQVFDEDMRREKNEAADAVVRAVHERDGAAVTVADEEGILDFESGEKFGQDVEGFVVHVADGAWFGEDVGIPVAIS